MPLSPSLREWVMGSPRLRAPVLTESERSELAALANRRRTAQGLAERVRIVLAPSEVARTLESLPASAT